MERVFDLVRHIYGEQHLRIRDTHIFCINNGIDKYYYSHSEKFNCVERLEFHENGYGEKIAKNTHPYYSITEKEKFEAMINDTFFHKPKLFFAHSVYPSYCTTVTHLNKILEIEWNRILAELIEKYMLCTHMTYRDISIIIIKFVYCKN